MADRPLCKGSGGAEGSLVLGEQLLLIDLLVGDLGELEQEIDHLFLEDRGAQTGERVRVLAEVVPDLLLLAGKLARPLHHPPSRPRRSAICRYSLRAFSSVVSSSAKVLFCPLRSLSICCQIASNSCCTSVGGASNLWALSSASRSSRLTLRRDCAA